MNDMSEWGDYGEEGAITNSVGFCMYFSRN